MEKGQNLSDFDFGKVLALYEVRDFILANMPHFIGRRWAKNLEAHCERLQSNIKKGIIYMPYRPEVEAESASASDMLAETLINLDILAQEVSSLQARVRSHLSTLDPDRLLDGLPD